LVLGGTGYIGPHLVAHALEMGYTGTLFNRGEPQLGLVPKVEHLTGDRNDPNGHEARKGRTWDVVYDLPTTNPLATTVRDALTWHHARPSAVQEQLRAAWRAPQSGAK
jgi:2'-hydroxyisoflavone reductase